MARRSCAAILWRQVERLFCRAGIARIACRRGWFIAAIIRKVGAKLALSFLTATIFGDYRKRRACSRQCCPRSSFGCRSAVTESMFRKKPLTLSFNPRNLRQLLRECAVAGSGAREDPRDGAADITADEGRGC